MKNPSMCLQEIRVMHGTRLFMKSSPNWKAHFHSVHGLIQSSTTMEGYRDSTLQKEIPINKERKVKNMKIRYFINGFTYGKNYFYSVGSFTKKQHEALQKGEVVIYNGNEFWIEITE